jgi:hypothetical protein
MTQQLLFLCLVDVAEEVDDLNQNLPDDISTTRASPIISKRQKIVSNTPDDSILISDDDDD